MRDSELTTTERGYGWEWQQVRLLVLERDDYVCAYCSAVATTVDHVIPKVRGGDDEPENLVAACDRCNYSKGDRPAPRGRGHRAPWRSPTGIPCSRRWTDQHVPAAW